MAKRKKSLLTNKKRKELGITVHGMRLDLRPQRTHKDGKVESERNACRGKDSRRQTEWE